MDVKIGLETHVQLSTESKIFCGCRNPVNMEEEPEPNAHTCETCLGMPGSKPRINSAVVESALKVAVALNCKVAGETFFSRKTYFYPDMAKNFQITQYEIPIGERGFLEIEHEGKRKRVRIKRLHIEEDPAKIVHIGGLGGLYTLVDYNRSGIPLIEIVTEPDLSSPAEARAFINKLVTVLEYLGVYDSSSRAVIKSDANISLYGGERVEIKNITGSREIEQALNYEMVRQRNVIQRGGKIEQSTRMWDSERSVSKEMRTKETEEDYGYIFEPDLTYLRVSAESIRKIEKGLPEMPDEKYRRFIKEYGIPAKVSESLVSELDIAELFEHACKKVSPRTAGSWISGYLKKSLNWHGLTFRQSGLRKEWIVSLLEMFEKGRITDRNAEITIRKMIEEKRGPEEIIRKHGLEKGGIDLEAAVKKVLRNNREAVEDYLKGEEKAVHYIIGLVMRETRGRADAKDVRKAVLKAIKESG